MTMRSRGFAAGALLVVTGAAIGIAFDHLVVFARHRVHVPPAAADVGQRHEQLLAELDTALALSPAQHDAIKSILARHQSSIDSAWRLMHRQVDVGMDSVHAELRAALRPDQMDALHAKMGALVRGH
jgi:ABC-type molybdate transport system ATPase subunit